MSGKGKKKEKEVKEVKPEASSSVPVKLPEEIERRRTHMSVGTVAPSDVLLLLRLALAASRFIVCYPCGFISNSLFRNIYWIVFILCAARSLLGSSSVLDLDQRYFHSSSLLIFSSRRTRPTIMVSIAT